MKLLTAVPMSAVLLLAVVSGCTNQDWSKDPLPVTVSAANYSQSSVADIFMRVHAESNNHPSAPAISEPDRPIFYAFVPGQIYASDVPLQTVYRELATSLARRGYFNVVYEMQSGRMPKRVDYLLLVHCGVRRWAVPTVRADDKVTWGNSGVVTNRKGFMSGFVFGEGKAEDPRAGEGPFDAINAAVFLQGMAANVAVLDQYQASVENLSTRGATRAYCLVVVQAFKFDDVRALKYMAPCIWSTFTAVPLHAGQEFSGMLPTMVKTTVPYYGTTSDGIQEFDVPQGKVELGEPFVVPGPQDQHKSD